MLASQGEASIESRTAKKKKKSKKEIEEEQQQLAILDKLKAERTDPWKQRTILDHSLIVAASD